MRIKKKIFKHCIVYFGLSLVIFVLGLSINCLFKVDNDKITKKNALSKDIILVNEWNPLPISYEFEPKKVGNGHSVDQRCYDDLMEMLDDCKKSGLQPVICSSYRSYDKQKQLFNNKVNRLIQEGYSEDDAYIETKKSIAIPGTSEHQLGLAVDIVDINNQNLDETQENTEVQKWLMNNSYKYGFILRYPKEKSNFTGIIYEPWHYRYVGKEAARDIYHMNICLEEYISYTCI